MITWTDFLALVGLASPFLLVLLKQTRIQGVQTEILKEIRDLAVENKEFHLKKENLCRMADDNYRHNLVSDLRP